MADTSQHLGGPGRVSVGTGDRGVRKVSASQRIFNLNEETESFPPSCPAHAGHCCCLLGIRAALELWAKGTAQQRINASEQLLEVTAVSGVNHGPIEFLLGAMGSVGKNYVGVCLEQFYLKY